jgi:hypothetical protein
VKKTCPSCGMPGFYPEALRCTSPSQCSKSDIREALEDEDDEQEDLDGDDDSSRKPTTKSKRTDTFVQIPHEVLQSKEYASLRAIEVKLLIDLLGQFAGYNNGVLCAAFSVMQKCGWQSSATLAKALKGLLQAHFIRRTRRRRGVGNLYGITWLKLNECKGKLSKKLVEKWVSNEWKMRARI